MYETELREFHEAFFHIPLEPVKKFIDEASIDPHLWNAYYITHVDGLYGGKHTCDAHYVDTFITWFISKKLGGVFV